MKITPMQQYIILGVIAFLGISFLYYQFLLKPVNNEIVSLQSTLEQKKKDLDDAKHIVAKYVEFKKRADSIQRELEWVQNRIPKTIDKAKMVENISFLQTRSGVSLTSFKFQANPVAKDVYTEVPADVRFTSDYKGLINFLYQMSLSNLFMIARDLKITPSVDSSNPNQLLSAQLVLSGIQAK